MSFSGTSDVAAFMATIIATGLEINEIFKSTHNLLRGVDVRVNPNDGQKHKTVVFPYSKSMTGRDAAGGSFVFQAVDTDEITVSLTKNAQDGFYIQSFDQATSTADLRKFFLQPTIESVLEQIEIPTRTLISTANFAVGPTTGGSGFDNTGGTANVFGVDKFLEARAALSAQKVPIGAVDDMSLMLPSVPYQKSLGSDEWSKATSVGGSIAESIRIGGSNPIAFATQVREDQVLNGLATGSGSSIVNKGIYMHRSAICLGSCYQPVPGKNVDWADLEILGLPLRVMMSYDHHQSAYLVSVNCQFGVAVGRPNAAAVVSIKATP